MKASEYGRKAWLQLWCSLGDGDPRIQDFVLQVLSWIDICAGLAAKTVARGPVVTASVDTVHFLRPCHQGSVAIIAAMVNRVFHSSMEASTAQHSMLS